MKEFMANGNIHFFVAGEPVALKRHRRFRNKKTGDQIQYDPSFTDKQNFLAKAMQNRPPKPLDVPVALKLIFLFPRPKSHYGTGKNEGKLKSWAPEWHTGSPDKDNLEKFVCDALDKIFWKNDKVICKGYQEKRYTEQTPGIIIDIYVI